MSCTKLPRQLDNILSCFSNLRNLTLVDSSLDRSTVKLLHHLLSLGILMFTDNAVPSDYYEDDARALFDGLDRKLDRLILEDDSYAASLPVVLMM